MKRIQDKKNIKEPDFIVIGAEKSGTTWLYDQLKNHPHIFLPEMKELHYFNKYDSRRNEINNFEKRSLSEYLKNFNNANQSHKAIGEITPMYLCDEYAPERIKNTFSNIKLIAILRNPVNRAYSHYWMAYNKNHTNKDFNEILQSEEHLILQRGLYGQQLKRYYKHFDKKQILVLCFENTMQLKEESLKEIFSFIGVNTDIKVANFNKVSNKSHTYRSLYLYEAVKKLSGFFRYKLKIGWLWKFFKKLGLNSIVKKLNTRNVNYPEIDIEQRKKLAEYYKKDIILLEELTSISFSNFWLKD